MPRFIQALSDEAVLYAVRAVGEQKNDFWVTPEAVARLLAPKGGVRERLHQLANNGKLQLTYAWRNFADTSIAGVNPAVGYCKENPQFRVL